MRFYAAIVLRTTRDAHRAFALRLAKREAITPPGKSEKTSQKAKPPRKSFPGGFSRVEDSRHGGRLSCWIFGYSAHHHHDLQSTVVEPSVQPE